MRTLAVASAALALATAVGVARADYMLPPVKERYVVIADDWTLDRSVTVKRGEKSHAWRIDTFWLADRVNSDSICTGTHEKKMAEYLDGLKKLQATEKGKKAESPLLVELVKVDKVDELFVAGVWKLDVAGSYKRALEYGSPALGLDVEKVKALGSEAAYEKALREKSDADWKRVESRPATGAK